MMVAGPDGPISPPVGTPVAIDLYGGPHDGWTMDLPYPPPPVLYAADPLPAERWERQDESPAATIPVSVYHLARQRTMDVVHGRAPYVYEGMRQ